jgi:formamidase
MEQYLTPMGPTKLHVHPIFEIGPLEPRFEQWLVGGVAGPYFA